jgi:hypothetical protein
MKYLMLATQAEAVARNAAEAKARGAGCVGAVTQFWWSLRQTAAGQWALAIPDEDRATLTAPEQSSLIDAPQWPVEVAP